LVRYANHKDWANKLISFVHSATKRTASADSGKFIAAETEKWGKVVKFAGVKPD